ncbi:unnamed protein product [Rotaria sordida]|uniref:Uncharacterized protein n=1 Tax=Rotaria sordida TaxID=392033 RepID=A0A814RI51_9BILA|nr:unnamed protein product [Rotaria sordida]CAF1550407.1 unnamed protein product [Rotaria sordida]
MDYDTCTFSYVATKDRAPKTPTGIECSWLDLKLEFNRQGDGVPGAKYYKTITKEGPQLYQTATDVKYDQIHSPDLNPRRGTFTSTTDDDDDDDEPRFGEEEGLN